MKSVLILNCCYTSNFGDQAIGITMRKLFETQGYQVDLYDLIQIDTHFVGYQQFSLENIPTLPLDNVTAIKNRLSFKSRLVQEISLRKWGIKNKERISNICKKQYDIVIFGGGELVQSNGIFPYAINFWKRKLHKSSQIYFFGIGVTNGYTRRDKRILKRCLISSKAIFVRDRNSKINVKEVFSCDSKLISDVVLGAYDCKYRSIDEGNNILYGITHFDRILRYGFNDLKTRREYYEYCYLDMKNNGYFTEHQCTQLLYADINDFFECHNFSIYLKNKYGISVPVVELNTFDDFEKEISLCKTVVSPRMHACIFGMLYKKNVCMVCMSKKTMSFYDEFLADNVDLVKIRNDLLTAINFIERGQI